ncbi:hypothetical protein SD80_002235 [Scytonema tolypothrichoides VB-61278]|nr:hypothetical protein SD80_002235 [Scytonema tolypothrichoides VB-61278]
MPQKVQSSGKEHDRWLARLTKAVKLKNQDMLYEKQLKQPAGDGLLPGYTRVYGSKGGVPNLRTPSKTIIGFGSELLAIGIPNVASTDETGSPHHKRYSVLVMGTSLAKI